MKANVIDTTGAKVRSVDLPIQFSEEFRPDLIQRAVLAQQSHNRQPFGTDPHAGMRASSSKLSRRRRDYKTAYGHGLSRVPRKSLWNRGRQFGWVGAFAPGTVKGRKGNPPKAEKIWAQDINIKERRKAIRSALAATVIPNVVKARGHKFKELIPVVDSRIELFAKTKDVETFFLKAGLQDELARVLVRKIRAGKGKNRNRPYKIRKGPLFVVSGNCPLIQSARNIPGVDVVGVRFLNAELLAPGCAPGRLTIFSEKALELLAKENLFMNLPKAKTINNEYVKVAKPVVKKPVAPKITKPVVMPKKVKA